MFERTYNDHPIGHVRSMFDFISGFCCEFVCEFFCEFFCEFVCEFLCSPLPPPLPTPTSYHACVAVWIRLFRSCLLSGYCKFTCSEVGGKAAHASGHPLARVGGGQSVQACKRKWGFGENTREYWRVTKGTIEYARVLRMTREHHRALESIIEH